MARRRRIPTRKILPDPKYGSELLAKFINVGMLGGKKSVFEKTVYLALETIEKKLKKNPIDLFKECIDKVAPTVEVRSRRVGGATFQVPMEVRPLRQKALSIRWIIKFARKRNERTMTDRLAGEFADILNDTGGSFKKKIDTHKMADANKAFAHFRW
ncbi:MAG: 30S ribosomal protein S7 [Alphaproteobacteria bacterium]